MENFDYEDHFALRVEVDATAEEWARAMFGDVPTAAETFIWRVLLGLRLSRGRSPDTVAGWPIVDRGDDRVRLETASGFLTANLIVRRGDGQVSLTTRLRYDRLLGRLIWPPLSAVHRALAPGLLTKAAARLQARALRE